MPEEEMVSKLQVDLEKDLVVCEVPYGGVLFLNNAIPHKRYKTPNKWDAYRAVFNVGSAFPRSCTMSREHKIFLGA